MTRIGDVKCSVDGQFLAVIELAAELPGFGMTILSSVLHYVYPSVNRSVVFCMKMVDDAIDTQILDSSVR